MQTNPFTFCPACKSHAFTLTNNRYFCDDCHFTFFLNAASAAAGIIVCGDEVLFTIRQKEPGKGKLGLPGGFVDFGESMEDAICRETLEELGVEITQWQYLLTAPNTYDYTNVRYHTCDGFFVAHLQEKPELTLQESEIAGVKWLKHPEIQLEDIAFASMRKALAHYLSQCEK